MKKVMIGGFILVFLFTTYPAFANRGGKKGPDENAWEHANENAKFKRDEDWKRGKSEVEKNVEAAQKAKEEAQEEANQAKRKAQRKAEKAKRKAQKEAEKAKKRAQREAEKAKIKAQKEAEKAKKMLK